MSMECQVNVKSQSELDIGGRETCWSCFFIEHDKVVVIGCAVTVVTQRAF